MKSEIERLGKKELREFGLITGAITVAIFGFLLPYLFDHTLPLWPWYIAGVLWALALVLPATLQPVYKGWMVLGHFLGWINTRIVLGIVFFTLFLPMGLIMKLLGKDPMARAREKERESYRVIRPSLKKEHVERPF